MENERIEYSKPFEKIEYLKHSIERTKNEKARSIKLLELGKLYFQVGDYGNALRQFNQSLAVEEKYRDFSNMAVRYYEIGLCYKANEDLDKALDFFSKAGKIFETNNDRGNMELVRANIDRINQARTRGTRGD